MNNLIKSKLEFLPNPVLVVTFDKDKNGIIIYVGKAIYNCAVLFPWIDTKTEALEIFEIVDFEFIVTESNIEALLLEINHHENSPSNNVMLKDDKSYPFNCTHNERYPRLIIARHQVCDGLYFGLYPEMWGQPMKSRDYWIGFS